MNDLAEVTKEPTFLRKLGFTGHEEDSTDAHRSVWYERTFQTADSQVRFIVQVEFESWRRDDPSASYTDNLSYEFKQVYLWVVDRRMEEYDDETRAAFHHYDYRVYDEESEKPRTVGRFPLNIQRVSQLRTLCKMLIAKQT
jgi:hypothetical protein